MKFGWYWNEMLEILPKAMIGWLGVFIVTAVIILCVWLLNFFSGKKKG